jgi:hypothetical protein
MGRAGEGRVSVSAELWTIINKEMHMHSLNVLYFFSVVGSLIF